MLTQLSCADTAYYSQFSLKAELQLKNKLLQVGGAAGEMEKTKDQIRYRAMPHSEIELN